MIGLFSISLNEQIVILTLFSLPFPTRTLGLAVFQCQKGIPLSEYRRVQNLELQKLNNWFEVNGIILRECKENKS